MLLEAESPPLSRDETGTLRVGETRVLVDVVLHAFQDGATPEAIAQQFPSASLADIYGVIGYYLRHREELDDYLSQREQSAKTIRETIERRQGDQSGLRERLLSRRHPNSQS